MTAPPENGSPGSAMVGGELIWPAASTGIRPLTTDEVGRLTKALGKPLDLESLFWLSRSIDDLVRFSAPPTARECRDRFSQIVREGRQWLEHIDQCPGRPFLGSGAELSA